MSRSLRLRLPGARIFFTVTVPEGDADHSKRWQLMKAQFARGMPTERQRDSYLARQERRVRQRRFWERHLRNDADFAAYLEYCWFNPIKHGFIERPEEWEWFSVHRDRRMGVYGWQGKHG